MQLASTSPLPMSTMTLEAQNKNGPYTQNFFLGSAMVNSEAKTVHQTGVILNKDKAAEAWTSAKQLRKALLTEISHRIQNPTFQTLARPWLRLNAGPLAW